MVDTTISTPVAYKPPFREAPLDAGKTAFSDAWVGWFTDVSDRLTLITQRVGIAEGDIAAGGGGVTDGSDAPAGHIGEFLSATASGGLTNATPIDRVTLSLPAGDWDVSGSATIAASLITMTFAQAWLSPVANTPSDPGRASIQSQTATTLAGTLGVTNFNLGPVRWSGSAPMTAHLGCHANFPGGTTVTAAAWIRARRMR